MGAHPRPFFPTRREKGDVAFGSRRTSAAFGPWGAMVASRWFEGLLDRDKFHFEEQVRVWRDARAGTA